MVNRTANNLIKNRLITVSQFVGVRPDSGSTSETITNYAGRGVFGKYLAKEIDGSLIQTTDEKLTILQNELFITLAGEPTETPAIPVIGDVIGGKRAMNVSQDPAKATWTVQLRK